MDGIEHLKDFLSRFSVSIVLVFAYMFVDENITQNNIVFFYKRAYIEPIKALDVILDVVRKYNNHSIEGFIFLSEHGKRYIVMITNCIGENKIRYGIFRETLIEVREAEISF